MTRPTFTLKEHRVLETSGDLDQSGRSLGLSLIRERYGKLDECTPPAKIPLHIRAFDDNWKLVFRACEMYLKMTKE